jgi:hypothetical protein
VGNLKVTPELLEAAAQAFEGLRVPIISDPNNVVDKQGADASYSFSPRVVFVHNQNVDDQIVKGAFLHEAVHMIHHQRGLQNVAKEYRMLIEKLRGAIKANPLYKSDAGVVLNYTAF